MPTFAMPTTVPIHNSLPHSPASRTGPLSHFPARDREAMAHHDRIEAITAPKLWRPLKRPPAIPMAA